MKLVLFCVLSIQLTFAQSIVDMSLGNKWLIYQTYSYSWNTVPSSGSGSRFILYKVVGDTVINDKDHKRIETRYSDAAGASTGFWSEDSVQFSGSCWFNINSVDTSWADTTFNILDSTITSLSTYSFTNGYNTYFGKTVETQTINSHFSRIVTGMYSDFKTVCAKTFALVQLHSDSFDPLDYDNQSDKVLVGALINGEVFGDEVRGIATVGEDTPDPGGGQQDHLRPMAPKPRSHCAPVSQVEISAACQEKIGVPSLLEATDQGAAHQPGMTGHENPTRRIQIEAAPRTATRWPDVRMIPS